jgi:hypothetical protein
MLQVWCLSPTWARVPPAAAVTVKVTVKVWLSQQEEAAIVFFWLVKEQEQGTEKGGFKWVEQVWCKQWVRFA